MRNESCRFLRERWSVEIAESATEPIGDSLRLFVIPIVNEFHAAFKANSATWNGTYKNHVRTLMKLYAKRSVPQKTT